MFQGKAREVCTFSEVGSIPTASTTIKKCIKCGYNKCLDALEFHHRDESEKEFTISVSKNYSTETLKAEVDKCELLCANCHRELHSEERNKRILK